jgi:hypothetical protein
MSEQPRIFDLPAAMAYANSLGATGVTIHTLRGEIAAGRLPRLRLGKRFYLSKATLDAWILRSERRIRA